MEVDEIIKKIAIPGTEQWHCYDTLRQLLSTNEDFRRTIIDGIANNEITGFSEELWSRLGSQNIRIPVENGFLDVLKDGYNQGYCTVAAKQVSFSLDKCYICGGGLPLLIGTNNCPDGNHTWIEESDWIIDTTLMLYIKKELSKKIGYEEENRYDPTVDQVYNAAKEFTNDSKLHNSKN